MQKWRKNEALLALPEVVIVHLLQYCCFNFQTSSSWFAWRGACTPVHTCNLITKELASSVWWVFQQNIQPQQDDLSCKVQASPESPLHWVSSVDGEPQPSILMSLCVCLPVTKGTYPGLEGRSHLSLCRMVYQEFSILLRSPAFQGFVVHKWLIFKPKLVIFDWQAHQTTLLLIISSQVIQNSPFQVTLSSVFSHAEWESLFWLFRPHSCDFQYVHIPNTLGIKHWAPISSQALEI